MLRSLALALALLASGCVLSPDEAEYAGHVPRGAGLVTFSVSQPAIDTFDRLKTKILLGPAGVRTTDWRWSGNPFHWGEVATEGRRNRSGLPGVNGQVFALAIPAGDYEVLNFYFTQQPKSGAGGTVYSFKQDHPLPFRLRENEVVYIGAFDLSVARKHNLIGIPYYAPGSFAIGDQSTRDLPELVRRFPDLRPDRIILRVVDGRSWVMTDDATDESRIR